MMNEEKTYQRWYDVDPVVSRCISKLENIEKIKQHQVAAFLTDEIVSGFSDDIYEKVVGEDRKRRWYDYDEACKIFVELLRNLSDEARKEVAIKTVVFIEDNE